MKLINRVGIKLIPVLVGLYCVSVQAVSLSTYRVYLDTDNNTASFIMFNKTAYTERCQLSVAHNDFSEDGKMLPYTGEVLPENSAQPWMRFSPKRFTVAPSNPQTVRFTLRRKSNMAPAEYRSYMKIDCTRVEETQVTKTDTENNRVANLSIKPKLIQNIPVVVRTGKLNASISMGGFSFSNGSVSFTISRKGERSVYGKIEVINKANDEVVSFKRNISIYPETKRVSYSMGVADLPPEQLAIRFTEDEAYGGNITYQQDVVLN